MPKTTDARKRAYTNYEARMKRERGMVRKTVWIPQQDAKLLEAYAAKKRAAHLARKEALKE